MQSTPPHHQGAFFFWEGRSPQRAVELDHWCGWRTFTPHKGNDRITCSVYGKAPTRQLHDNPIAVSASGHTGKQIISFDAVIRMQEKSASRAFLSRMQRTLHAPRRTPNGASRLVLSISAWSVKTRCAPSRRYRVARVYGHTSVRLRPCMIMSTLRPGVRNRNKD